MTAKFRRIVATLFALALICLAAQRPMPAGRNILVLIADDLGVDASSIYPAGTRQETDPPPPPTPNLQKLADAGILFRNAWANPLCVPSRAAIFTGRYGFRTGVGSNLARPELQALTAAEVITPEVFLARPELGYRLAHIGKWHVSPGANDPNLFGWPYFAGGEPSLPAVPDYKAWTKYINGVGAPTTTYATTDAVNEAIAVIRRARREAKPYYIEVAFNAPHDPFHEPPRELHTRGAPASISARRRPPALIRGDDRGARHGDRASLAPGEPRLHHGDLRRRQWQHERSGGAALRSGRSKSTMYENGVRVPMLLAGAGVRAPGRVVDGLVNTVDIFPTVLQLAGIDPKTAVPASSRIDGVSLLPYMRDPGRASLRKFIYAERFDRSFDSGFQRAIRNTRYKLIQRSGGGRELYDLKVDPLEQVNLLTRPLSVAEQNNLSSLEAELTSLLASR